MASTISSFYHRRASIKSASKPTLPTMIPFRNAAGEVQYTSAPLLPSSTPHSTPQQTHFAFQGLEHNYDSDGEPLLASHIRSHTYNDLSDDAKARFTATGRPIPIFAAPTLQTWGADMFTVPQFLPVQYTDDSIIPAIVTNVIRSPKKPAATDGPTKKRRNSIANIFKGEKGREEEAGKVITKVVFMPRREYLKFFAKDDKGEYVGTEPKREWTEDQLDQQFGEYRPKFKKDKAKRNNTVESLTPGFRMG